MKKKSGKAMLLAAALAMTTLAGCGQNKEAGADAGKESDVKNVVSDAGGEEKQERQAADNDEIVKLRVWGYGYTSTSEECDAIAEAVSEITREKIGVEVELVRNSDGEKLNLALTSGEKLDLVNAHSYPGGLNALVNNGMAMPLDDLAEEYAQEALQLVGEDMIIFGKISNTLYSIPNLKDFAVGYGTAMRKDVLEELDIDPADIKTINDVHDVFVRVKEERENLYPLVPTWEGGGMQKTFAFDALGPGIWDACGVLENVFEDSTTVVNLFETDSYREFCEMMYQWNQEGLILPDATTFNEANPCGTVGFASFDNVKPGKEKELREGWKREGVLIGLVEPFMASDGGGNSFFIPSVCEYPEKAMQLWNLMFTDPEISNLFVNGIVEKNYTYVDDSEKVIRPVEGSTYDSLDWAWPNGRITPVFEGDDLDKWEQLEKFCEEAHRSPAMGFRFDSSGVVNEMTACRNVISKYEVGLRWGVLDPKEALPKFNEELKAAGMDTIIAEKQSQLDAFLAGQQ